MQFLKDGVQTVVHYGWIRGCVSLGINSGSILPLEIVTAELYKSFK